MKAKYILFFSALFLSSLVGFTQPPGEEFQQKSEKIQAMKIEFITTKLELTPNEAEKFWPIYNEFTGKIRGLAQERRKKMISNKGKELTDAEVNALIKFNFDTDQKMLDLKREYDSEFKSILPVQKVGKLYQAEMQFKHELLRKMRGNGNGRGSGGPPKQY